MREFEISIFQTQRLKTDKKQFSFKNILKRFAKLLWMTITYNNVNDIPIIYVCFSIYLFIYLFSFALTKNVHNTSTTTIQRRSEDYTGMQHIIDFSLCAVIVRSAFAAFTPRGFERFRKDL
jgi:hypothetical protein